MKTKILLFISILLLNLSAFSTTWTVTNSGTTFTPATITINLGDSVDFNIDGSHNVVEVSQATWNLNGNTPLSGGFTLAYGGGTLLPAQLTVGTHYYVCDPHASMGMKGTIIVQNCSAPAQPAAITGNVSICSGSSNSYSIAAVSGATSYTWSLPSGWSGSSTTTTITTVAGTTSANVSVTANNACGASAARTLAVTVNTPPAQPATISGNASVCSASSNTYSIAAVSGATSYTWSLPAGWSGTSTTSTITAVAGATGGTVSVTANNSCGASAVKTLVIAANTIPVQPASISGNASVCSASSNTYSIAAVSGATSYTWTLPSGWSGTSVTATITAVAGATGGTVSVTANNSCGASAVKTLVVTSNTVPAQPAFITGNLSICSGSSNSYAATPVSGAASYTWTIPTGWTGSSSTNTITVVASATAGNISVTANNVCGASLPQTFAVAVLIPPAQPASVSGNASVCSGSSNTYSIAAVSGAASYSWSLPSGWSGTSATTTITALAGASGGTVSVTANNSCGASAVKTYAVSVNAIPSQPSAINGSAGICSASSNTYSIAAVSGATSYSWTLPSGWSGSSATASITALANNSGGIITVKANNSCGSSATQTLTVTINTVDTAVSLSGSTLTANATAATYQWINCNGNTPVSGQTSQSFTASASGSYAVIVTKNGCSDTSFCHTVTIAGINEAKAIASFSVYPNPSKGRFIIETKQTENSSIEIYNLIGELSYQTVITAAKTEIDFSRHAGGIYFVKYYNGNTIFTKRIVVE